MTVTEEITGTPHGQILFRDFESALRFCHHFQSFHCIVIGSVGDKNTVALCISTSDASSQLMQLRHAESIGILNDDERRIGYINTNFNNRGGNENIDFAFGERSHDTVFFLILHLAMYHSYAHLRKCSFQCLFMFLYRGEGKRFVVFNGRAYHIDLPSGFYRFLNEGIQSWAVCAVYRISLYRLPTRGHFIDHGNIEIAVDHKRQCSGNGCCRHYKHMGVGGFLDQLVSLGNSEPVLLVGNDQSKVVILYIFAEEGMSADDEMYGSFSQTLFDLTFFSSRC